MLIRTRSEVSSPSQSIRRLTTRSGHTAYRYLCAMAPSPSIFSTVPNIYLFLQNLDLDPLVVELVALLPHSLQQLCDALLLGVDHLLIREESWSDGRC